MKLSLSLLSTLLIIILIISSSSFTNAVYQNKCTTTFTNANTIFVSNSGGSDSNAGTNAAPKATIAGALAVLNANHVAIVLSIGTHSMSSTLTWKDGVGIYGGYRINPSTFDLPPVRVLTTDRSTITFTGTAYNTGITMISKPSICNILQNVNVNGPSPSGNLNAVGIFVQSSFIKLGTSTITSGNGGAGIAGAAVSGNGASGGGG